VRALLRVLFAVANHKVSVDSWVLFLRVNRLFDDRDSRSSDLRVPVLGGIFSCAQVGPHLFPERLWV